jgi:muconolactone D-isomerase
MEYLVTMTTHVPDGTSDAAVQEIRTREAAHSSQLAAEGHLLRLWRPPVQPGQWRTLGLFAAGGPAELESVLLFMPLRVWRTDEVLALSPHPNDPGPQSQRGPTLAVNGGNRIFHDVHHGDPAGHAERHGRCHGGERGRSRTGIRRARTVAPALAGARQWSSARAVAGPRRRRDAENSGVATIEPVDARRNRPAWSAPK